MSTTEAAIRHLLAEKLPMVVVINKVDRLIIELRLPPADAYYKLKQTIEEVNTVIRSGSLASKSIFVLTKTLLSAIDPDPTLRVSPELGNVAFASASMGWCFTLRSFAKMYADTYGTCLAPLLDLGVHLTESPGAVDVEQFAKRLWGNLFYHPETRKFSKKHSMDGTSKRGFRAFRPRAPVQAIYPGQLSGSKLLRQC